MHLKKASFHFVSCLAFFAFANVVGFCADDLQQPPIPPAPPVVVTPTVPPPVPIIRPMVRPGQPPPPSFPVAPHPELLKWDATRKEVTVKVGAPTAEFVFAVTNISETNVTINAIQTSCGCTVAKAPPMPWTLAPHSDGKVEVTVNLAGKFGTVMKQVTVVSPTAQRVLDVVINIPENPEMQRARNTQIAAANPSQIFMGDCARCHVQPTIGKMGKELYGAACGICHESERRATMVPDLKNLPHPTNHDTWKEMITNGKPGTLMPGFSITKNGPLTDGQIESVAQYLATAIPSKTSFPTNAPAALNGLPVIK